MADEQEIDEQEITDEQTYHAESEPDGNSDKTLSLSVSQTAEAETDAVEDK